jgi:hypothetical protein
MWTSLDGAACARMSRRIGGRRVGAHLPTIGAARPVLLPVCYLVVANRGRIVRNGPVKRVLVIGHSHIVALKQAHLHDLAHLSVDRPDLAFDFVRLFLVTPGEASEQFGIGAELRSQISSGNYDLIVSCVGGNGQNAFGLANHPVPFDFVVPEEPDLSLSADAETLPASVIRKSLREHNDQAFIALREIKDAATSRVIHVESPPPSPNSHIVSNPGYFEEVVAKHGVAPAVLRYKLWRLNSFQFRDFCAGCGIEFMLSPPEFRDAQGMLVESARDPTPTHANGHYGAAILSRIAAFIPATIAS